MPRPTARFYCHRTHSLRSPKQLWGAEIYNQPTVSGTRKKAEKGETQPSLYLLSGALELPLSNAARHRRTMPTEAELRELTRELTDDQLTDLCVSLAHRPEEARTTTRDLLRLNQREWLIHTTVEHNTNERYFDALREVEQDAE